MSANATTANSPTVYNTSNIGSIAKVVNPLGTVTTIIKSDKDYDDDEFKMPDDGSNEHYLLENCDEALFRPVVTVIGGLTSPVDVKSFEKPAPIGLDLIVPVIEKVKGDKAEGTKISDRFAKKSDEPIKVDEISVQSKKKTKKSIVESKSNNQNQADVVSVSSKSNKNEEVNKTEVTVKLPKKRESSKKEIITDKKEKSPSPSPSSNQPSTSVTISKISDPQIASKSQSTDVKSASKNTSTKISEPDQNDPDISVVVSLPVKPKKRSKLTSDQQLKVKPEVIVVDEPPPPLLSPDIDCTEYVTIAKPEETSKKSLKSIKSDPIIIDDFPPLNHVVDHFSIRDSLIKNSDYVMKTGKTSDAKVQPLDSNEILNFKMMTLEDNICISDDILPPPSPVQSDHQPEQFFDSTPNFEFDINESVFESLAPLEPFIDNFEPVNYTTDASDELMNFESPKQECSTDDINVLNDSNDKDTNDDEDYDDDDKQDTEMTTIAASRTDNNSSDDTEDSYTDKKDDDQNQNDDDELEPLISTATTSSDTTPNFSKAIVDSLPDNSNKQMQQDSSNWPQPNKKRSRKKKR